MMIISIITSPPYDQLSMQPQRHDEILRCLGEQGVLTVDEAVRRFGASPATVRRDFNHLADSGSVQRVRGGIRLARLEPMAPFALREVRFPREKLAIAAQAAAMLSVGDVVFVDGGTTTLQLGSCLPAVPLRIITNSVRLAAVLETQAVNRAALEIFLTGGFLYPNSGLLVGPAAQRNLADYHAHWAFLSAGGVTAEGVFNTNELVVESERLMIANAEQVVLLADHSKLGQHAMRHVGSLEKIDILITDDHPESEPFLESVVAAGVEVIRVRVGEPIVPRAARTRSF